MEKCWHFVDTLDEFKKIRGLDAYYPNESAKKRLKTIAAKKLHNIDMTGKEGDTYAPLCAVIQDTLDEAAKMLPKQGALKPMAVRDTSDRPESDSQPVVKHGLLMPDAPHPTYSINDGFDKKADLVLYRKTGAAHEYFEIEESKKRARASGSKEPLPKKPKSNWVGKTAWNFIETYIEVKTKYTLRAFEMGDYESAADDSEAKEAKTKDPLPDTNSSRETRGQLAQYAGQIMLRQHRCFVYSVFILQSRARLIYWDRSGAVVSPSFDIKAESNELLHFMYALGRVDDARLGHDPTATLIDFRGEDDKKWEAAAQLLKSSDPELYARVEEAAANNWPKYKVLVSGDDCKTSTERWKATRDQSKPPAQTAVREFLVAKHAYGHRSPTGRGCKGYVAFDLKTKTFNFLKDFWRTTLPNYPPESVAYNALESAKVPQVLTFVCGGDVEDAHAAGTKTPNLQRSIAHKYSKRKDELHHTYQHGRLVIEQVGRELKDYKDSKELAVVLRDALDAHRHAWDDASLLHRDISDRNIVIYKGRGFLIDWDLAKTKEQLTQSSTRRIRSGTWRYMSGLVCRYPLKPYELSDDLESFIRVFTVLILRFHKHRATKTTVRNWIRVLDSAEEEFGGVFTAVPEKTEFPNNVAAADLFYKKRKDKDGATSPNLITLFQQLNTLSQQHNWRLSALIMRPFIPDDPDDFKKVPADPDYMKAHEDSPLYTHTQILKVLNDVISKTEGWVENDKSAVDFFADMRELVSHRTKNSSTSHNA